MASLCIFIICNFIAIYNHNSDVDKLLKAPDGFELENKTFLEDGSPEYLEWVPFDTEKTIYPEFFKTELKNPSRETKYIVADERKTNDNY